MLHTAAIDAEVFDSELRHGQKGEGNAANVAMDTKSGFKGVRDRSSQPGRLEPCEIAIHKH
jgi:hypothetical protein